MKPIQIVQTVLVVVFPHEMSRVLIRNSMGTIFSESDDDDDDDLLSHMSIHCVYEFLNYGIIQFLQCHYHVTMIV